jgi:Ca2+-binding RTX toxin-like protein
LTLALASAWSPPPAGALPQVPASGRASVSSAEAQGNGDSTITDLSPDGRFVVFSSLSSNLVSGDGNGDLDVFVRDRILGTTERISVSSGEVGGNGASASGAISDDGNLVAFASEADNLVTGDTQGHQDVFLRDRAAGTTTRVGVANGEPAPPNADAFSPLISGDGGRVAFTSEADNLVADDENGEADVFVRDLGDGTTVRASVSSSEVESDFESVGSALNQTGSVVLFQTEADDLIGANDTNDVSDVYARRVDAGTTFRVSVGVDGVQGDGPSFVGRVDDAGSRFTFESEAGNLVGDDGAGQRDVFFRSIVSGGTTSRVSEAAEGGSAHGDSSSAFLNGAGTEVAFESDANDLVAGDATDTTPDVFVHDLVQGSTRLVSRRSGIASNGPSGVGVLADNGIVAFVSGASNLVPGDTNGKFDVFVAGEVCDGQVATVDLGRHAVPTAGPDVIIGSTEGDTVNGLGGNDRFCGLSGNDSFTGGLGADRAFGGPGNDTLNGQDGADRLVGNAGADKLFGGNQPDALFGSEGPDKLDAGAGNDQLDGGAGGDTCNGRAGTDRAAACEVRAGIP